MRSFVKPDSIFDYSDFALPVHTGLIRSLTALLTGMYYAQMKKESSHFDRQLIGNDEREINDKKFW